MQQCPRCSNCWGIPCDCLHSTCEEGPVSGGCGHQFCYLCLAPHKAYISHGDFYHRPQCSLYNDLCCPANCIRNGAGECVKTVNWAGPCQPCRDANTVNACNHFKPQNCKHCPPAPAGGEQAPCTHYWRACKHCIDVNVPCTHYCSECVLGSDKPCMPPGNPSDASKANGLRFRVISHRAEVVEEARINGYLTQECPNPTCRLKWGVAPSLRTRCQRKPIDGCGYSFCFLCGAPGIDHGRHYHRPTCTFYSSVCCDARCIENGSQVCVEAKNWSGSCSRCRGTDAHNRCTHFSWRACGNCRDLGMQCNHFCSACAYEGDKPCVPPGNPVDPTKPNGLAFTVHRYHDVEKQRARVRHLPEPVEVDVAPAGQMNVLEHFLD